MILRSFLNYCGLIIRLWSFNPGPFLRYTPKRVAFMIFAPPFLLLFNSIHWLCLGLDHIFFPGFKKVEVKEPVFIVGLPRSGTTFLHRVVSLDEQFTSILMWESVFAPSITQQKFWGVVSRVDRALGGLGRKLVNWIDDKAFGPLRHIHPMSLFWPEEDELFMLPTFASLFMFAAFPFREQLGHLARFDWETPEAQRREMMQYYKGCVQRHLYFHGPEKRLMSKNPLFTVKVQSLRETFPDCRIIVNVRHPVSTMGSIASLAGIAWKQQDNAFGQAYADTLLEIAEVLYRYPIEVFASWPENRHVFMRYQELVNHPGATIRGVYQRLEIPLSAAFSAVLDAEEAKARGYRSTHAYNLEEYGLSEAMVREQLGDIIARYDLDSDT